MLCLAEYLAFFLEWPVHNGMYSIIISYVIQPLKNEKCNVLFKGEIRTSHKHYLTRL
jgi:hypothetical protein